MWMAWDGAWDNSYILYFRERSGNFDVQTIMTSLGTCIKGYCMGYLWQFLQYGL